MRRFELSDGSSHKFWEIELGSTSFEVRWGRIGTGGQSQSKTFPNAAKAQAEHDKLVKEKRAKGYAEIGAARTPAPSKSAAARPTTAKSAAAKPAVAKSASKPTPAKAAGATRPAATISAPPAAATSATVPVAVRANVERASDDVSTDPSTWPAAARAELHPVRGMPVAPIALDREDLWSRLQKRAKENATAKGKPGVSKRLAQTSAPREPAPPELEAQLARRVALREPGWKHQKWTGETLALLVDHWVATGGITHAVEATRALAETGKGYDPGVPPAFVRLAHHLALASDADYAATARAARLDALPGPSSKSNERSGLIFAFGLGDVADAEVIAAAAANVGRSYPRVHVTPLVVASIRTTAALDALATFCTNHALKTGGAWRDAAAEPTLATFVVRFGEAVLAPFSTLLDKKGIESDVQRALAWGIGLVGTARAFELLAGRATERIVLPVLRDAAIARPVVALRPLVTQALQRGAAAAPCRTIVSQLVRDTSPRLEDEIGTLSEAGRKLVAELRAKAGVGSAEASMESLPAWLRSPAWLSSVRPTLSTVEGLEVIAQAHDGVASRAA
jgi:predicted DNA-binding WGR domain protein